jgi:hypothetical protein
MKSEDEIKKKFNAMWKLIEKDERTDAESFYANSYRRGWFDALDWVSDGKLIDTIKNKVIK